LRRVGHDVARAPDPYLIAGQRLAAVDVDRVVARAVFEPRREGRPRPMLAAVAGADDQVLVLELLSWLPQRLVLAVQERDVDRAVGADRRHRGLILVTLAGCALGLEGAEGGPRAGDLLRLRPMLAAVVAMALEDRRLHVLAMFGDERGPRHVGAPVKAGLAIVVGGDPLLVAEVLERIEVATPAGADDQPLVPGHGAITRAREDPT